MKQIFEIPLDHIIRLDDDGNLILIYIGDNEKLKKVK